MHIDRARSFGRVVAITALGALAVTTVCCTSTDTPPVDTPQPAARVAAPNNAGSSPPAAAAASASASTTPSSRPHRNARAQGEAPADAGVPLALAPFHIVGRSDARDPAGPRLGWPATEIRARFSGGSLSVVLSDSGTSYYDVSIDGAAPTPLIVTGAAQPYVVATGLAMGEHDVILTKRTETATGVTQLLGFVGTLVPSPAPSARRIELIGDSITCGFGVLGASEACPFSPGTEDEPLAWGSLAARQLGALHMVTAVSGLGVIRNFGGDTADTMPQRYDRAVADDASSTWDHQAFEPDVVVLDLGTNDFNDGKGDPGPAFLATYTSFLATLRARNPQAHIIAATSPMLENQDRTTLRAYVMAAVAARQSAGDAKVSWLEIDQQSAPDGYGCDYHPNITTHAKMAATLVAHVKSQMGW